MHREVIPVGEIDGRKKPRPALHDPAVFVERIDAADISGGGRTVEENLPAQFRRQLQYGRVRHAVDDGLQREIVDFEVSRHVARERHRDVRRRAARLRDGFLAARNQHRDGRDQHDNARQCRAERNQHRVSVDPRCRAFCSDAPLEPRSQRFSPAEPRHATLDDSLSYSLLKSRFSGLLLAVRAARIKVYGQIAQLLSPCRPNDERGVYRSPSHAPRPFRCRLAIKKPQAIKSATSRATINRMSIMK